MVASELQNSILSGCQSVGATDGGSGRLTLPYSSGHAVHNDTHDAYDKAVIRSSVPSISLDLFYLKD